MLSILIPVYNYNVVPLVLELHKQCLECEIDFEIKVIDDGSKLYIDENQEINSLSNCHFEVLAKNIGRSAIRNLLAKKAEFDSLLFLDADTIPTYDYFIKNYIVHINEEDKIIYGGIQYQKEKPNKNQILRWVYGKQREALSVKKRQENLYLSFLTLNFLIQKSIFEKVSFNETIPNLRHEDTLFSYNLMQQKIATSNFQRAMSMVIPRSRSALSLSSTHAYLNEDLPISADSFSNFSKASSSSGSCKTSIMLNQAS